MNSDNIQFCLGSMFYPKKMIEIFTDEKTTKKVKAIHGLLYEFSPYKLELLENEPSLKYLLKKFIVQN